jgi:hypothetical protein
MPKNANLNSFGKREKERACACKFVRWLTQRSLFSTREMCKYKRKHGEHFAHLCRFWKTSAHTFLNKDFEDFFFSWEKKSTHYLQTFFVALTFEESFLLAQVNYKVINIIIKWERERVKKRKLHIWH